MFLTEIHHSPVFFTAGDLFNIDISALRNVRKNLDERKELQTRCFYIFPIQKSFDLWQCAVSDQPWELHAAFSCQRACAWKIQPVVAFFPAFQSFLGIHKKSKLEWNSWSQKGWQRSQWEIVTASHSCKRNSDDRKKIVNGFNTPSASWSSFCSRCLELYWHIILSCNSLEMTTERTVTFFIQQLWILQTKQIWLQVSDFHLDKMIQETRNHFVCLWLLVPCATVHGPQESHLYVLFKWLSFFIGFGVISKESETASQV